MSDWWKRSEDVPGATQTATAGDGDDTSDTVEMLVLIHKSIESIRSMVMVFFVVFIASIVLAVGAVLLSSSGEDAEDRFREIEEQLGQP
jgi:hypothetical protein